jgi:predicted glycosyl hydrolase (DUF1957 family)
MVFHEGYPGDYIIGNSTAISVSISSRLYQALHTSGTVYVSIRASSITVIPARPWKKSLIKRRVARIPPRATRVNFIFNRQKQVEYLYDMLGKKPIIVSPYDASCTATGG